MFTKKTVAAAILTSLTVIAPGCAESWDTEGDIANGEAAKGEAAELTGAIDVYATTENGVERDEYFLRGAGEAPIPLHFQAPPSLLRSGDAIGLRGNWQEGDVRSIVVGDWTKHDDLSLESLTVTGVRKALVIFTPGTALSGTSLAQSCPPSAGCAASSTATKNKNAALDVFDPAKKGSFAQFLAETSGNATHFSSTNFATVVAQTTATLPQMNPTEDVTAYATNAVSKALASIQMAATSFSHVVVVIPSSAHKQYGSGQVGGPRSVISDDLFTPEVVAHELGHNLGLNHAPLLSCGSKTYELGGDPAGVAQYGYLPTGVATSADCKLDAYDNKWDPMGYDTLGVSAINGHYNVTKKVYLGWLKGLTQTSCTSSSAPSTASDVKLLCQGDLGGVRFLKPLEASPQSTSVGVYGVQIPIPGDTAKPSSYVIEYRRAASSAEGFGSGPTASAGGTADGVFVYGWRVDDRAYLLEGSPTTPWVGTGQCITVPYSSTQNLNIKNYGYVNTANNIHYNAAQVSLKLVPVGQGC